MTYFIKLASSVVVLILALLIEGVVPSLHSQQIRTQKNTAAVFSYSSDASSDGSQPIITNCMTVNYSQVDASQFPTIVSYVTVRNDSGLTVTDLNEKNFTCS